MAAPYNAVESRLFPGWYEIPGYPNNLANKNGEILNVKTGRYTSGGNAGRYLKVKVYRGEDQFQTMQYVHELVCRAFAGPRVGKNIVSHKDSNKKNNTFNNLEWDSQSNNVKIMYSERRKLAMENAPSWSNWSMHVNVALEFLDDSVKRIQVHSSNVSSVGYDPVEKVLEVEFHSGTVYQYFDVPEDVYLSLMHAVSIGKHLNQYIKGKYQYTKI